MTVTRLPVLRAFMSPRLRLYVAGMIMTGALAAFASVLANAWLDMGDFRDFYESAGHTIWAGQSPYLPVGYAAPDQILFGPTHATYPPTFYLLVGPWIFLPAPLDRLAWLALLIAAFAGIVLLAYTAIGRPTWTEGLLVVAAVSVYLPVREDLHLGQVSGVINLLMVIALWAVVRRRAWLGGVALGLAIAVKLSPVLLLLYLAWKRAWTQLLVSVGTVFVLFGGTIAMGWGRRWPEYAAYMDPLGRGTGLLASQSLNGVLLRVFRPDLSGTPPPPLPSWLAIGWHLLQVALVVWVVMLLRRVGESDELERWTGFGILLLALPLLEAFAWFHHFAGGVVVIAVMARLMRLGRLRGWVTAGLVAEFLVVTLLVYPAHLAAKAVGTPALAGQPLLLAGSGIMFLAALSTIALMGLGTRRVVDLPTELVGFSKST